MDKKEILQKIRSVRLCLLAHPDYELHSEFSDRIEDLKEIESHFENQEIKKLFVWENVLCDYKSGIAFVYAESPEEARELIIEKMGYISQDLILIPREIKEKEGFYVYGGG